MSAMVFQTTGFSIICSTVCSGSYERKHQSSALLAFVGETTCDLQIPLPKDQ